jgi:hypothetical protein
MEEPLLTWVLPDGIAMGGLFGPAAATALEDLPYDARGILSGVYEQAYAVGYLLAAIFYRAVRLPARDQWHRLLTRSSWSRQLLTVGDHCSDLEQALQF